MGRSAGATWVVMAALLGSSACAPEPTALFTVMGTGVAGLGDDDVAAAQAQLYMPMDVIPDGTNAYVVDWNNNRIRRWDRDGDRVWTAVGSARSGDGPDGVAPTESNLNHCTDLAPSPDGRWLLADWHNHRLRWVDFDANTIEAAYGTGDPGFAGDGGPAVDADFSYPVTVRFDSEGALLVADQGNNRVRRIDGGVIQTVVGTGRGTGFDPETGEALDRCVGANALGVLPCYEGDGGPALQATLNNTLGQSGVPMGRIEVDGDGGLWIADTNNHVVRFVDPDTGIIDTVAGAGAIGGDDGDAQSATFASPHDLALAPDGSLYIADTDNHCIRVLRDGVVSTAAGVCGEPGYDGDGGPPGQGRLNSPYGVAVQDDGLVLIADTFNHVLRAFRP